MYMRQIESIFFKAMLEGYVFGVKKIRIPDLPGYKAIPFRDGDYYVLDHYCVTSNSLKSAGTTTIWYQDVPVWVMNYGGFYEESAISFLKSALRLQYEERQFNGGRGPLVHTDGTLIYRNMSSPNDFSGFQGRENIHNVYGILLGYHDYWGMSLL